MRLATPSTTLRVVPSPATRERIPDFEGGAQPWREGTRMMRPSRASLTLIWQERRLLGFTSKAKSSMSSSIIEGGPTMSTKASST